MVKLIGALSRLSRRKILVAGDLLLDTYTIGKAKRISPEAPVAIINVQREEHLPGGSGNVMLNLISMGCEVVALGRTGSDEAGRHLQETLSSRGVDTKGILPEPGYDTPVKNRIIAENQQIVRVDYEKVTPLTALLEQQLLNRIPDLISDVDALAISDYGKGFLSKNLLQALILAARQKGIPIITDPKGVDFSKYQQTHLLKPNLSEAYAAAGYTHDIPLEQVASKLLQHLSIDTLMITRSEEGISLFHRTGEVENFPVRKREVKDVTGAGDTVLAMVTCALASGLSMAQAAQLSNVAAGIAIEHFGCAQVSLSELARELLLSDASNKIFDEEHLYALQQALKGQQVAIIEVKGNESLTPLLYKQIQQLGRQKDVELILAVQSPIMDPSLIEMLASLSEVDFVLVCEHPVDHVREKLEVINA